jgi:hypothetical protein
MQLPRLTKISVALIVAGAGLAWIGLRYGGPSTWAAVAVFGLLAVIGGLHSVVTRRHVTAQGYLRSAMPHHHTGAGAVLLGITMLAPGLVMVLVGLAGIAGLADGLGDWAVARPGPIMMTAGAWAGLGGLGLLISKWRYEHQSTSWWQRVPGQMVGLILILIGGSLIAAGRVFSLDAADPRAALERIAEWITRLLAG